MAYVLDMGDTEQFLIKQALRCGQAVPDRIVNAPKLLAGMEFYLNAFFELNTERTGDSSIGPIPWGSIQNYARAFDLKQQETESLHYQVRQLDNAYLKIERAKEKAKRAHGQSSRSSKATPRKGRGH